MPKPKRRVWPEHIKQEALTLYLRGASFKEIMTATTVGVSTLKDWSASGAGTPDKTTWIVLKSAQAARLQAHSMELRGAQEEELVQDFLLNSRSLTSELQAKLRDSVSSEHTALGLQRLAKASKDVQVHGSKALGLDSDDGIPKGGYHLHLHGGQPSPALKQVSESE